METDSGRVQEKHCCGTCAHYCQHYVLNKDNRFIAIWYGHCLTSDIKEREPDAVCPDWTASMSFDALPLDACGGEIRSYPIRMKWE